MTESTIWGRTQFVLISLPLWLLKWCPEGNFPMNERAGRAPVKFSLAFSACSHVSYLLFSVRSTIDCSFFHACPPARANQAESGMQSSVRSKIKSVASGRDITTREGETTDDSAFLSKRENESWISWTFICMLSICICSGTNTTTCHNPTVPLCGTFPTSCHKDIIFFNMK